MNRIKIFYILLATCCVVNGQQGLCRTVEGEQGECKSIHKCQPLLAVANKPNRTPQDLDILRRSQCGFDGNAPAVCCPEATVLKPVAGQCFTPDGKPGQCINLYSCIHLVQALKPPVSNELIKFLEKSKCNGPDQYSVCCGPEPTLIKTQKANCADKVSAFPPDPKSECCGIDAMTGNKIVGGEATTVDQYPWMALIEYQANGAVVTPCGGVLISGRYVLTAAHCVAGRVTTVGRPTHIRLAEYDTSNDGPDCTKVEAGGEDCTQGAISIPIEKIIPHPQYNPKSRQKKHDIALIRMRRPAPFTDFIRPICLPSQDITFNTKPLNLTAAGWGLDESGQNSPIKLQVELPIIDRDQCAPNTTIGSVWKGQLCAGGMKGQDSCRGDSGGPLMYEISRRYEVVGIVSVGAVPCGSESIPGVYTNVYEYVSWITSNIVQ